MSARGAKKVTKASAYDDFLSKMSRAKTIKTKTNLLGGYLVDCVFNSGFTAKGSGFAINGETTTIWTPQLLEGSQYFWFHRNVSSEQNARTIELGDIIMQLRNDLDEVKTKTKLNTLFKKALPDLKKEYKVHIQANMDIVCEVVRRVLLLKKSPIKAMKVLADFQQAVSNSLPMIVLYFDLMDDTKTMFKFIDVLVDTLKDIDEEKNAIPFVPRFNRRVSALVYWAQSSGDLKEELLELLTAKGWKNTYFTDDYAELL